MEKKNLKKALRVFERMADSDSTHILLKSVYFLKIVLIGLLAPLQFFDVFPM